MEDSSLIYDVNREQSLTFLDVMSKYKLHLENTNPSIKCQMILMDTPHQQKIYAIVKETQLLIRLYTLMEHRYC